MSTVSTIATEATALLPTETLAAAETVLPSDPSAATGAAAGLESIKELMDAFDPAALLPDLSSVMGVVATAARIAVLAGPIVLLVMGLMYLFLSPKEANYRFGYRCYFGMGSVEAWRFTQRLAGIVWGGLGLVMTIAMVLLTGGYGSRAIMEVVDSAVTCLIWEIVLTAVSCLVINGIVMLRFDRNGALRKK